MMVWPFEGLAVTARRRTPTVLQMETAECGAAALAIVCGYWGLWKTLEELRILCNVSRDGSSAAAIARAARLLGLTVTALRTEPEALRTLDHPVILHWQMNHFIVLETIRGKTAWINDPATGPRTIPVEDLNTGFTGIMLDLTPGPGFAPGGRKPSLAGGIRRRLSGQGDSVAFTVFLAVALIVPGLLAPVFTQIFVDQILIARHGSWLVPMLCAMAACGGVTIALTAVQREVLLRLETALVLRGALGFARHVLRLPLSYLAQRHAGEVASRVMLSDRVAQMMSSQLGLLALSALTATAYFLGMLVYAPLLTLPVAVAATVDVTVLLLLSRRLQDLNRRVVGAMTYQAGFAKEGLQMIEGYAARGQQDLFRSRLTGLHARLLTLQQQVAAPQIWLAGLPVLTGTLAGGAVLVLGGRAVIAGDLTIGTLIAFQALMIAFFAPFGQLIQLSGGLLDGLATLRCLDDTLDHPQAAEFSDPPVSSTTSVAGGAIAKGAGAVTMRQVSFGYTPTRLLLHGIDLSLAPGERLGVVGPSGSGKSTLGALLARHVEPVSGEICLDGCPVPQIRRDLFRAAVGYVDQHSVIFSGTVRENITLWDQSLPDERVIAACRLARIHDDILRRPGGYGAMLTEGGRTLSGGQRARLELARVLVTEPRLLILDEATAALDAETEAEAEVMEAIASLGLTTIVIAHRLSALNGVDQVIVLEAGQVVDRGTPAELLARPGLFRTLMEADQ